MMLHWMIYKGMICVLVHSTYTHRAADEYFWLGVHTVGRSVWKQYDSKFSLLLFKNLLKSFKRIDTFTL